MLILTYILHELSFDKYNRNASRIYRVTRSFNTLDGITTLRLGTVALDGTKIHANASRHSALSYEHAGKIEAQLKAEVAGK